VVVVVLCDWGAIAGSCEVVVVVVWLCAIAPKESAAAKAAPVKKVPSFLNAIVSSPVRNRNEGCYCIYNSQMQLPIRAMSVKKQLGNVRLNGENTGTCATRNRSDHGHRVRAAMVLASMVS
jgi:hypothetical protein